MDHPYPLTALLHAGIKAWAARTRAGHPAYLDVEGPLAPWPEEVRLRAGALYLHALRWPGEGRPLVLLHGLNNTAWIWARPGAALAAAGLRVIAPTLRGHGRSDTPADGYALERTSADLEALLDEREIERLDLAGHSWGGKVALHFAATRPQRVRSLVLADPAPPAGLSRLMAQRTLVRAAFRPERGPFPDRDALEARMPALLQHQVGDETDRRAWQACFTEQPDGSFHAALADADFDAIVADAIQSDITPQLPGVACPVLLMLPQLSLTTSRRVWVPARQAWGPRLQERRMVGDHTFVHTNPRDTVEAMLVFLRGA